MAVFSRLDVAVADPAGGGLREGLEQQSNDMRRCREMLSGPTIRDLGRSGPNAIRRLPRAV
jgi:hypothetical protein